MIGFFHSGLPRNASIRMKLVRTLILLIIIPLIPFSIYTYINTRSETNREFIDNGNRSLSKGSELINNVFNKYSQECDYIITNSDNGELMSNLQVNYSTLIDKVLFFNSINLFIGKMEMTDSSGIKDITFYISNKTLYENDRFKFIENAKYKDFINRAVAKSNSVAKNVWLPYVGTDSDKEQYIYLYRNLIPDSSNLSVLQMRIPFTDISFYMRNLDIPTGSLVLYKDGNGKIIGYDSEGKSINGGQLNLDRYILLNQTLANSQSLVVAISKQEINARFIKAFALIMAILIMAAFCMIFTSVLTSRRITSSLEQFISMIQNDRGLLFNLNGLEIKGNDEISLIKQKFKELAQTITALNRDKMEACLKTSKMEMDLLQTKINPHLLYNSLSVIKWTAQRKGEPDTVTLVDSLTRYYRKVLNKGNNVLRVRDEINLVREYITIVSYSHAARYDLEVDVEESLMQCYTFKLILQPLVENAVLHGLSGKEGEKRIEIRGRLERGNILLTVEDNGYGMPRKTIDAIMNEKYENNYGGYGMKNLIKRVRLYYGEESKISIESEEGKYTRVRLTLPLQDKNSLISKMA